MNTRHRKDWNHHSNIDRTTNASVIAAGLLIVLFAAATADNDPATPVTRLAKQDRANRTAVAAQAHQTETTNLRVAGYGDSVRLATAAAAAPSQLKPTDLNGDDHAK